MSLRDWFWVVLLGAIWGGSFLFNEILIREIGPLSVSAGRVGIGALGSWVFFFALRRKLPREPMLYVHFLALGLLSYAIPFALYPISQAHLASGVAAIVNAMTPIMTVIVSHFWPNGERASWGKSAGVAAGFTGVAILTAPALMGGGASQVWAVGLCLCATLCYALALNYTRSLHRVDPSVFAACALTGATLGAAPVALVVEGVPHLETVQGWGALLGIGLLATTFAFQVMYRLLPRVGPTNFTTVTFIAPISAILFGVTLLGETILVSHLLGMAAIFVGLLLIDGRIVGRLIRRKIAT